MRKNYLLIITGLALAAIPIWMIFISPNLLKLPNNFTYLADILSLDNLYNEELGEFSGEISSITRFSYRVSGVKDSGLEIKNVFDVRSINGDNIFSTERIYGVDPYTGEHLFGLGDKDREGYLLPPRGLKKGEPFTYWHVNYDGPANMEFIKTEDIWGLETYVYETKYEEIDIDQTSSLSYLPGVPELRGVILDPILKLWVEPVSGHLVKYEDFSTAYYYDIHTNERIVPWNKFHNKYKKSSILDHVQQAKQAKFKILLITKIVPILLSLVAIASIIALYTSSIWGVLILLLGVVSSGAYIGITIKDIPSKSFNIAISQFLPNSDERSNLNIQGFKDALYQAGYVEGENINYVMELADSSLDEQQKITQSIINGGFDLIYSLNVPGTAILKKNISDIPIVFSLIAYPVEIGLIDSVKTSNNNLVGTRDWIPINKQMSIIKSLVPDIENIGFIHVLGGFDSSIQLQKIRETMARRNGSVHEIGVTTLTELKAALKGSVGLVDSLYSACDILTLDEAEEFIIAFAKSNSIPSFSCSESGTQKGGLASVVADSYTLGKLAGEKATLILEGLDPSFLSTDTVISPFLYVNKTTAQFLGLSIPQDLIGQIQYFFD